MLALLSVARSYGTGVPLAENPSRSRQKHGLVQWNFTVRRFQHSITNTAAPSSSLLLFNF
jgi:hypothetical protein